MRPGILFSVVGSVTVMALAVAYAQVSGAGTLEITGDS